jgi:hypothetical protein
MLPASRTNDEYFHPFPDYRSGVGLYRFVNYG